MVLNDSIKRQKDSTKVMEELIGLTIADLQILPGERILRMDFDQVDLKLIIHLFSTNSNFFIVDQSNVIINSFKKRKALAQTCYFFPKSTQIDITAIPPSQFMGMVKAHTDKPLAAILKKNFFHLNQTIMNELLFRLNMPADTCIEDIQDGQLATFHSAAIEFLTRCEGGDPRIYFRENLPHILSLTKLKHLHDLESETFEDTNCALRRFNVQSLKYQILIQKKGSYAKSLDQRIQYLEKTSKKLEERQGQSSKKEYYQKIGELILAQPQVIQSGASTCQLVDYFDPDLQTVEVSIDPQLNAQENAEAYFQKAKDFDRKQAKRRERAQEIRRQLKELYQLKEELAAIDSYRELEKLELRLKSQNLLQKSEEEAQQLRLPYKKFGYKDWEIWVGRSARDNDALSFKHAHKEDWWLHVQGYAGSHVVIRNPQRRDSIPPEVLEFAARLAVTHSEAKHASYVPVLYTRVKYVRKPRKAPPGTVIPDRTKTIYADPIRDG